MRATCVLRCAFALSLVSINAAWAAPAAPRVFGVGGYGVCAIDTASEGFAEGVAPLVHPASGRLALSPGAELVYAGVSTGLPGQPGTWEGSAVDVVDVASGRVLRTIAERRAEAYKDYDFVLSPDGGSLFVGHANEAGTPSAVLRYAAPSGALAASIPLPGVPNALAVAPDGRTLVVATRAGLSFVDTSTNRVTSDVDVGGEPVAVALSGDNAMVYASVRGPTAFGPGWIVAVSLPGRSLRWAMGTTSGPSTLAINGDGTRLYVSTPADRSVVVVNTSLRQFVTSIFVEYGADGLAVTPDDARLYVSVFGRIRIFSTATNEPLGAVTGCAGAYGIAANANAFIGPAGASIPIAVEYYHGGFGHYFLTNGGEEIDLLDTGAIAGWARTGQSFGVYLAPAAATPAVCRFFTTAFGAKSSHFYAPRDLGCEATFANPDWQFEGDVFFTKLPDTAGACPAGTDPVYRMYNDGQGGAPNHRLSTSLAVRDQMLGQGWIAEGAGIGVGMCAPQAAHR